MPSRVPLVSAALLGIVVVHGCEPSRSSNQIETLEPVAAMVHDAERIRVWASSWNPQDPNRVDQEIEYEITNQLVIRQLAALIPKDTEVVCHKGVAADIGVPKATMTIYQIGSNASRPPRLEASAGGRLAVYLRDDDETVCILGGEPLSNELYRRLAERDFDRGTE